MRLQNLKRVTLKEPRLGSSTMFGLRIHSEEFTAHVQKLETIVAKSNFKLVVEHKECKGYLREIMIEDNEFLNIIDDEDEEFFDVWNV
ncbi:hypothetical protein SI65_08803 [Aspergillus cristatus]|uniref:Uncharacterized protein n=1 Tax=Aspergillus cristatus TaxID=573508 RepID=A0A1E3B4S6_ASPCR|nr:hypothetical protein SI65_08803 [Aspergillus cristatus]